MAKQFIFIDESGDPDFFGKRKRPLWLEKHWKPILLIGSLATNNRKKIRKAVLEFQQEILSDTLFNSIYSVKQPNWYLHAKDDHPEVRIKFFEFIRKLEDIVCYIIIARKNPKIFANKHNNNPKEFYFDVLYNLLQHFPFFQDKSYQFYLSRRDSANIAPFSDAINKVVSKLTTNPKEAPFCTFHCDIVKASEYPELSVLDYLLWATQRYILKGERRYFTALEQVSKYHLICDVYDTLAANNLYNTENPFTLEKASKY